MINSKKFYWLAQFGGWASYSGLLTLSVFTKDPNDLTVTYFINILILIVSGIATTHIQRLFFIRFGWLDMKLPALIPRLIVSSLLCSIVIAFIDISTDYITNLNDLRGQNLSITSTIVTIFAVLILVLFWNAIYFTFHFFQKSRKQEISNLELAASKRESELKNLRSQLNPHFLFNSLNSIRALVDIDPSKSKHAITTLSNLLRKSLILGKENLVSLSDELEVAKSYLDLEKIRFEERLTIEWEIDGDLEGFQIPPFSLQMMIENAIKHGISNLVNGGFVKISAYQNDEIVIEVRNSGSLSGVTDLGVGIENVQKRLALQYGDKAMFILKEEDYTVVAQLKFEK